jgi:hypothetical protein
MTTTTRTPIADLSAAQIIKLTLDGHLVLKDGAPAYSDKAEKAAARNAAKARHHVKIFFGLSSSSKRRVSLVRSVSSPKPTMMVISIQSSSTSLRSITSNVVGSTA